MSTDDQDKPKRRQLRVTEEVLGENEMYRVRRREVALHLEGASEADLREFDEYVLGVGSEDIPFERRLRRDLAAIEATLGKDGYPPPRGWVLVKDDHWGVFPEDWNLATAAAYGSMVEVLDPDAPHRIETGANYIKRRAEALSPPWWLGRLGEVIVRILDEPDPDKRLTLTLLLGEERRRLLSQKGLLAEVRRGTNRKANLDDNNEQRTAAAAPWQRRAETMAASIWTRNPKRSVSNAASIICNNFIREAETVHTHVTEQWPATQNERDEERRDRKIVSEIEARGLLNADGNFPAHSSIRRVIGPLHPRNRK